MRWLRKDDPVLFSLMIWMARRFFFANGQSRLADHHAQNDLNGSKNPGQQLAPLSNWCWRYCQKMTGLTTWYVGTYTSYVQLLTTPTGSVRYSTFDIQSTSISRSVQSPSSSINCLCRGITTSKWNQSLTWPESSVLRSFPCSAHRIISWPCVLTLTTMWATSVILTWRSQSLDNEGFGFEQAFDRLRCRTEPGCDWQGLEGSSPIHAHIS